MAYYSDEDGKVKKSIQNGRRLEAKPKGTAAAEGAAPSEAMIKHLQRVLSAIEGRRVSREEVLRLRQHSVGEEGKIGHNAAWSDEHPP